MTYFKCVVVGDIDVNKFLSRSYQYNECYETPICSWAYNDHIVDVTIGEKTYQLFLSTTVGQEHCPILRQFVYPDTDVVLVCFSIANPDSFESLTELWIPEIKQFCPGVPFLLVGTRAELRDDASTIQELARVKQKPVPFLEGEQLASDQQAVKYVEWSALSREGVKNVLDEAVLAALNSRKKTSKKCCSIS